MNLDDAQRARVAEWMEHGCKLSVIQNKLAEAFGIRLTYMDVRFLIDDLKLKVKDVEPPQPPEPLGAPAAPAKVPSQGPAEAVPLTPMADDEAGSFGGGVSVTVDQVTRAGALVSGKVKFSDGKSADWYLDQYGRLGLAAQDKGYRPSQEDLMNFQAELQSQLAKLGY